MRTTLTLDDDVAAKLGERCRKSGRSFKVVINEVLRESLTVRKPTPPRRRFQVRTRALGLRAGRSYDNIGELLEEIERHT